MTTPIQALLKPIETFINRTDAIELKANAPGMIGIELKSGQWIIEKVPELTLTWWRQLGQTLGIRTGQQFRETLPLMSCTLPGGHRLMLIMGPNVLGPDGMGGGVMATIRLLRKQTRTFQDFGLDEFGEGILRFAVANRENIIVAGSTGSGKTSLTNLLCELIEDVTPMTIEDVNELHMKQKLHQGFLVSPVTADTDFTYKHALNAMQRSRPDRIVLGELTADNSFIIMRALNVGLQGMITTLHCDTSRDGIPAVVELLMLGSTNYNPVYAENYLRRKINMVVYVTRVDDRRMVTEIYCPHNEDQEAGTLWQPDL